MQSMQAVVPLDIEGVTVLVEATCSTSEHQSTGDEIESKVSGKILSFEKVTQAISAISSAISRDLVKSLSEEKPTKSTVEFGVELQYQSGQILAVLGQGSGKVNFKITLEWDK
ncbi:CU044_2847 family protein [Trichocoleus sp. FACHB-262]|uniref:CU044_2847 family protein n=1 Tax=Trichocoleus sp. FACHB-262 TaxID=2692869 RepID=UPI001688D63E|nr:CU044_2847 family protein [Trichocoleus sp. FACHB-262]MBD2124568.1 hypothetical protein [Trichocoleus sp. FACHB-262]